MKLLKKMSVATAAANKAFLNAVEKEEPILRVVGIARSVEDLPTQYGIAKKFKGEFRGTDLQTGEISASPVLYLPSPIDGMLADAVAQSEGPVEFAFDINVVPLNRGPDDTGTKYQYVCRTLIEAKPSDPLAALISATSQSKPVSLPAPKEPEGEAPEEPEGEAPKAKKK